MQEALILNSILYAMLLMSNTVRVRSTVFSISALILSVISPDLQHYHK